MFEKVRALNSRMHIRAPPWLNRLFASTPTRPWFGPNSLRDVQGCGVASTYWWILRCERNRRALVIYLKTFAGKYSHADGGGSTNQYNFSGKFQRETKRTKWESYRPGDRQGHQTQRAAL